MKVHCVFKGESRGTVVIQGETLLLDSQSCVSCFKPSPFLSTAAMRRSFPRPFIPLLLFL